VGRHRHIAKRPVAARVGVPGLRLVPPPLAHQVARISLELTVDVDRALVMLPVMQLVLLEVAVVSLGMQILSGLELRFP
jgi:hypothetical protein